MIWLIQDFVLMLICVLTKIYYRYHLLITKFRAKFHEPEVVHVDIPLLSGKQNYIAATNTLIVCVHAGATSYSIAYFCITVVTHGTGISSLVT